MRRFLALLFGLCAATPAAASDPVTAFETWARAGGAEDTAISVLIDGTSAHAVNATRPVDLASNSKAITALCVLSLVEGGALSWDTPLTTPLGPDAPPGTVAELITHSAGIGRDSTQLRMGFWLNEETPRHAHVADIVLKRNKQRGTRGEFAYTNENYALLGRIIEVTTGESYEQACRARVLDPAGVDGALSPRFAAFAAWGGWRMAMAEHAALLWHWFGPQGRVGRDPLALPHIARGEGRYYGLGMNYAAEAHGFRISHAGAISIPFGPKTGAYAVVYPFGAVAAMGYDAAVADPARFMDLSNGLANLLSPR